jgi:hypothetical protein
MTRARVTATPVRAALVAALWFTASGCSGVDTNRDRSFDFAVVRNYAWKEPPQFVGDAEDDDVEGLLTQAQRRIDRALTRRGIALVDKSEADVVLSAKLRVETRVQDNDPQFAVFVAEEYEVGTLELEIFERLQRRSVWSGRSHDRLRYSSRATTGVEVRFVPTDEPRTWHLDDMVDRITAQLPGALGKPR